MFWFHTGWKEKFDNFAKMEKVPSLFMRIKWVEEPPKIINIKYPYVLQLFKCNMKFLPKINWCVWEKYEKGKCFFVRKKDDKNTFDQIKCVVKTILNTIDCASDMLLYILLKNLSDGQVNNPQSKSG